MARRQRRRIGPAALPGSGRFVPAASEAHAPDGTLFRRDAVLSLPKGSGVIFCLTKPLRPAIILLFRKGRFGPLVKRLRQRPLTPLTWVRFPHGSLEKSDGIFAAALFIFVKTGEKRRQDSYNFHNRTPKERTIFTKGQYTEKQHRTVCSFAPLVSAHRIVRCCLYFQEAVFSLLPRAVRRSGCAGPARLRQKKRFFVWRRSRAPARPDTPCRRAGKESASID